MPPDAVLSHTSAAIVHGLPITDFGPDLKLELVADRKAQTRKMMRVRRRTTPDSSLTVVGDVICTDLEHTLLDLAIDYPLHVSVPALDNALHDKRTTIDQLRQ